MKKKGYAVRVDRVRVGAHDYVIRALADKQQFWDPDGAAARVGISSSQWPLFGNLWPSGRVLAEAMDSLELDREPDPGKLAAPGWNGTKRILELGCGLGLASVVLHRRGGEVTSSDLHPLAGAFLIANTALNALSPIAFRQNDWSSETVIPGVFDVIIGSDLLYEPEHATTLAACIARHGHLGTEVVIVDPGRGQGGRFSRLLESLGYRGGPTIVSPRRYSGIDYHGSIYRFRRAE